MAQENVVLAVYGELPDELRVALERHLTGCDECRLEWTAMQALEAQLALNPVLEPSPNLLAQSRMRLDEALDQIPPHGFLTRLRSNFSSWMHHVQGAPALTTLLLGVGFLAGNFTYRYQVAHQPRQDAGVIVMTNPTTGAVANVTGIVQTPDPEVVQVNYNRVVPETMQGSLDNKEIRELLLKGMAQGANTEVHERSVNLLSNECKVGHACTAETDGKGIRSALLVSLRYDKDAGVRLKALEGLQPYVGQDQHVRDAILEAVSSDKNAGVRKTAISLLTPVQSDSSVRQVLRTVSTQDENPYIRTASFQALQGSAEIQ
ncbi:HEAT repeat domain-containing protein [Granulicella arctica]|uniref:HEAT repeat domain-containing protein n=1 Tax=Granulicella arctica TaxID=940613 RepID=UPI0021DF8A27|nr:HEAT repeat domain-containing protein [Granulicella arctica]